VQTSKIAIGNENRYPDRMLRNIDPGIANDCNLNVVDRLIRKTTTNMM
jgi:hypothetical protein